MTRSTVEDRLHLAVAPGSSPLAGAIAGIPQSVKPANAGIFPFQKARIEFRQPRPQGPSRSVIQPARQCQKFLFDSAQLFLDLARLNLFDRGVRFWDGLFRYSFRRRLECCRLPFFLPCGWTDRNILEFTCLLRIRRLLRLTRLLFIAKERLELELHC